jgi:hypothetical protein
LVADTARIAGMDASDLFKEREVQIRHDKIITSFKPVQN